MRPLRWYLVLYAAAHPLRRPVLWVVVLSILATYWLGVGHWW